MLKFEYEVPSKDLRILIQNSLNSAEKVGTPNPEPFKEVL